MDACTAEADQAYRHIFQSVSCIHMHEHANSKCVSLRLNQLTASECTLRSCCCRMMLGRRQSYRSTRVSVIVVFMLLVCSLSTPSPLHREGRPLPTSVLPYGISRSDKYYVGFETYFLLSCNPIQVSREENTSGPGYEWSISFLTDVEPSATSTRLVASDNGVTVTGTGDVVAEVSQCPCSTLFAYTASRVGFDRD